MKLADLFIKLGLKKDGFDRGIDGAKQKTNAFSSAVKKIGGIMAGAFAVERIFSFGKELLELGGIAEGVESAFKRIAGVNTLNDLKDATRGTVSELELMKRAVSAQNLGLPVENLASLFEFATKRAQDTGESVDYLVNSIVTGIGRKSPLILDNLGISAIQLREKLKGVGMESASVAEVAAAVGEIAADSMRESGEIIETNAIKMQKMKAAWDDFKKSLAESEEINKAGSAIANFGTAFIKNLPNVKKDWENWGRTFNAIMTGGISLLWQRKKAVEDLTNTTETAIKKDEEFNNLLAEINVNAEENNKIWEEKFKLWEKQNEQTRKAIELTDSLTAANEKYMDSIPSGNDFFTKGDADVSGIVGGGGVFDMLSPEKEEDIGFDTEARVAQIEEFSGMMSQVASMAVSAIEQISKAFGEALVSGDWDNFGKAVLQSIGGFLQQMGGLMIAYGVFMALFDKAIKAGPIGWPLAIAAGIGLVAAGAAISSLASGGVSGASTGYSGATSSSNSSSAAINGDVRFVLEGDKLVGAIDNSRSRRRLTS
jgi:hypothetical protein